MLSFPSRTLLFAALVTAAPALLAVTELYVETPGVIDLQFTGDSTFDTFSPDFATSLVTADFDGDGAADLAVSTPDEVSLRGVAQAGRVAMFKGGAGFRALNTPIIPASEQETYMLSGTLQGEKIGSRMVAGDFNKDGFADLVVYSELKGQGVDGPRLYVLYGKATFSAQMETSRHADSVITQSPVSGLSSTWNSLEVCNLGVGDVNGDTIDDLVICDDISNSYYVLYGSQTQWAAALDLQSDADVTVRAANYDDLFTDNGISGLAVGDLNADGIADMALGLSKENVGDPASGGLEAAGKVYVVHGASNLAATLDLPAAAALTVMGGVNKEQAGGSLAIGDLDADGTADLVIGAPLSGLGQVSTTGIGRVQVVKNIPSRSADLDLFFDADVTLALSAGVREIGYYTGFALSTRDLNGDGTDDLTISTPNANFQSSKNGWVHTVYGGSGLQSNYELDKDADLAVYTPEPPKDLCCGEMGYSLSIADMDANGSPDLLLGAPRGYGATSSVGWLAVLFDAAQKGAAPAQDPVNSVDPLTFQLSLPVVDAGGLIGMIWAKLDLIDPFNLVFQLAEFGPTTDSSQYQAVFNEQSGALSVPLVTLGEQRYQAELQLISGNPIQFQVTNLQNAP